MGTKCVLTVQEAAKVLRIGRDLAYNQVKAGIIPSIKLGRRYRIPIIQLNAYLEGRVSKNG